MDGIVYLINIIDLSHYKIIFIYLQTNPIEKHDTPANPNEITYGALRPNISNTAWAIM